MLAQGLTLAVTFVLIGLAARIADRPVGWKWSLLSANPITIGLGSWIYRTILGQEGPPEYFAYLSWALLILLSLPVLTPAVKLGAGLARGRSRAEIPGP